MDAWLSHMEKTIRSYGLLPRRFNSGLILDKAGFIKDKDYRIRYPLTGVSFSFLLKGSGDCVVEGCRVRLEAPCVFMQFHLEPNDYGPEESWDELFLSYQPSDLKTLQQRGLHSKGQFTWGLGGNPLLWSLVKEMREAIEAPKGELEPDRLDRMAERLILESHLSRRDMPQSFIEKTVRAVSADLSDLSKEISLEELASKHGVSLPTLRRYWSAFMKVPLSQFRSSLVMAEAGKLLLETDEPVQAIARKLKFRDALYFSRKFSKETGMSPVAFRERLSSKPIG